MYYVLSIKTTHIITIRMILSAKAKLLANNKGGGISPLAGEIKRGIIKMIHH